MKRLRVTYQPKLRVQAGLPSMVTAYHCGSALTGDKFDFQYVGNGEGYTALGPGIYFLTEPLDIYCKYREDPHMYTVQIESSGLYDPIYGEPEHLRDSVIAKVQEMAE